MDKMKIHTAQKPKKEHHIYIFLFFISIHLSTYIEARTRIVNALKKS